MADPIRELLSQVSYDADGTTTIWNFTFAGGYLERDHVRVQTMDKVTREITQYPITQSNFVGDFQLELTPPVAVGLELTIYRNTPKDVPLVNFADRAALTEAALDLNAKQAIFVAAEAADTINTSLDAVSQIGNLVQVAEDFADAAETSAIGASSSAESASYDALSAAASAASAAASAEDASLLRADLLDPDQGAGLVAYRLDPTRPTYRTVQDKLGDFPTLLDFPEELEQESVRQAMGYARESGKRIFFHKSVKVRIPADCLTLQEAIDNCSASTGSTITLEIQAGHRLTRGLYTAFGDYSAFVIKSVDAIVLLDDAFVPVVDPSLGNTGVIIGRMAKMPRLGCVVDAGGMHGIGFYCNESSTGFVDRNCGVINGGVNGLSVRGSVCYAERSVWHGANDSGIRLEQAATVSAQFANCDNCMQSPTTTDGAVFASRNSTLHFQNGLARNSGLHGAWIQRSRFNAQDADFSGAAGIGVVLQIKADAILRSAIIENCASYGLSMQAGAQAESSGASIRNNNGADGRDIFLSDLGGCILNLSAARTTNSTGDSPFIGDVNSAARGAGFNTITSRGLILVSAAPIANVGASAASTMNFNDVPVTSLISNPASGGAVGLPGAFSGLIALHLQGLGQNAFQLVSRGSPANPDLWGRIRDASGVWSSYFRIQTSAAVAPSIASAPSYVGQVAVVGRVGYLAVGTAAATDWVQTTN